MRALRPQAEAILPRFPQGVDHRLQASPRLGNRQVLFRVKIRVELLVRNCRAIVHPVPQALVRVPLLQGQNVRDAKDPPAEVFRDRPICRCRNNDRKTS